MRLTKGQKQLLLQWIAEGLQTNEINDRAKEQAKPFGVTRQQVDHYRKTRKVDLQTISKIDEMASLTEGYATKEERVHKLSILAALMEKDLLGGFMWLEQQKGVAGTAVDVEEFNKPEVDAYRGVLDDIARETGGRVQKQELTGKDGGAIEVNDASAAREQLARLLASRAATGGTPGDTGEPQ